ncbi:NACHT domain-containing protein [Edaphocola aurantiacus]|uniref:NACHT domain-containing protein n=1 Tax=Edaphocola aurantiacus TaxID=2601682 RepID=UPI001C95F718|nr:ATP-binding protein [Edaphocola aurantiacus]
MSIVECSFPSEIAPSENKPPALANQSYPYNDIASDRRFEELLYTIVKSKIDKDSFYEFDQVGLMSGVRDKGRDCVLLRGGKNYGLIQCKKYRDNLGKQTFGEEITKFALYSIIDPSLIHDSKDFKYFIAVSTGFVLACSDFIDDFSNKILVEPDLDKWINKNLNNPTLAPLKLELFSELKVRVCDILYGMEVIKLPPQGLDLYLSEQNHRNIAPHFFELKTVIDSQAIEKLRLDILGIQKLDQIQIREELQFGSSSLKLERNTFDELPDSHIARIETDHLFEWISTEPERDKTDRPLNLILLAGNPGMGKTVILKDLFDRLTEKGIPVLGLKADKLAISNINDLQHQIGLSIPVHDFIKQCKQQFEKTIIVIDQIDALSQAMSADRSALLVVKSFFDKYVYDPEVRIIMSVRVHDLHYDPSLSVYKHIKSVSVSPLGDNDVLNVLQAIGISKDNISAKLFLLLRTPNHLNVFTRIAKNYDAWRGITNIQGLYLELWKQKVLNPYSNTVTAKEIKAFLYKVSARMYAANRISVSIHQFDEDIHVLNYLKSELLIKEEDNNIQFFHQSFYDFVFAKQFVESNGDLVTYIKDNEQAIQIRSAIKMVINYLRDYDPQRYLQILEQLLIDNDIYFHIKQMLVSVLAFQEQPLEEEVELFLKIAERNPELQTVFLEYVSSKQWLPSILSRLVIPFIEKSGLIIGLVLKDTTGPRDDEQYSCLMILGVLYRSINVDIAAAWKYVLETSNLEIVYGTVSHIQNWDDERALSLLARCEAQLKENEFRYHHVLEEIAKTRPDFSWDKIRDQLISDSKSNKNAHSDYHEFSLLRALAKVIPEKLIVGLHSIIDQNLDKENILNEKIITDRGLSYINIEDKDNLYGKEYLYRLLAVCLRRAAAKRAKEFRTFLDLHANSVHKGVLRLIVFALTTNEEYYPGQIFNLFIHLHSHDYIKRGETFSLEFRELLQEGFSYMCQENRAHIVSSIKNLIVKGEIWIYKASDKPFRMGEWGIGRYSYLLRLPKPLIQNDKELIKIVQEGDRRFPDFKEVKRNYSGLAGVVRRPLPEVGYQKMSKDQWIASFRKYSGEHDRFAKDFLKGGLHEHSWAFKDWAVKDPSQVKIEIIEMVMDNPDIHISYAILGLLGMVEAKVNPDKILPLFKRLLNTNKYQVELRLCITIAGYLVGEEKDEPQIVDFLIENALKLEDRPRITEKYEAQTSINGLVTYAMNTTHGYAAEKLVYITDRQYEEIIFSTLDLILQNGPPESKAILLCRFAHLIHLNKDRAFNLFIATLDRETDVHVLASSIWSLRYMLNHDFARLSETYRKLISAPNLGKDDIRTLVDILYFSYLFDKPGADILLNSFLENNSGGYSHLIRTIIENYYINENAHERSSPILMSILRLADENKREKLNFGFYNIDHIDLLHILEFLKEYVKSKYFVLSDNFLEYLTQQCGKYPFESINLFNMAMLEDSDEDETESDSYFRIHRVDNISKFIIGAYNSLKGNDPENRKYRNALIKSFDTILKDFRYRRSIDRLLEDQL